MNSVKTSYNPLLKSLHEHNGLFGVESNKNLCGMSNAIPQIILGVMWIYQEDGNLTVSISIGVEMVFL
jgi:hypothetical protein